MSTKMRRNRLMLQALAVVLALLALAVAFAPEDVPGLTIPGSHQGAPTMDSMQMR